MRLLLPASLLIVSCLPARAQLLEVYGTFSPTRLSNVETGSPSPVTGVRPTASFWAPGVGGGVTFGVLPIGPIRIGFDLRGSTRPGTAGADTAFGGVKVGLRLPLLKFKPYAQASGGYVASRTTNLATPPTFKPAPQPFTNQYVAYEILGGVDYSLIHFFDLRLVEIGGGKGYPYTTLIGSNHRDATLFTVNSGIVFHF